MIANVLESVRDVAAQDGLAGRRTPFGVPSSKSNPR
jgi:hypothetical protein